MDKQKMTTRFILLLFLIVSISCTGNSKKTEKSAVTEEASLIEVSIGGMTCSGCEQTIQNNIGNLEGIKSVKASFALGNAVIAYFPGKIDTIKIKEAVTGSGYTVNKFQPVQPEEVEK